jgi:GntR family transcriptional repressor for pyruvate dehydrogenase complex
VKRASSDAKSPDRTRHDWLKPRPAFRATRAPKTAEMVASQIRRRIILGELSEGDSLPVESELCETFQVSRPTLREAFRLLEAEALISIRRGDRGGPSIHQPTVYVAARHTGLLLQYQRATVGDVYRAFSMLLPAAAKRVAERHSTVDLTALRQQVKRLEETPDIYEFLQELTEFNYLLLKLTKNNTIGVVGQLLFNVLTLHLEAMARSWQVRPNFVNKYVECTLGSLHRLLVLIEAKDGEGAERFYEEEWREDHLEALIGEASNTLLDLAP